MLAKIEEAYLYILRVVILIAATLALIGAVIGVVRVGPAIASLLENRPTPVVVPGGTLGDFVTEKRIAATAPPSTAEGAPSSDQTPQAIKDAVDRLAHYDQSRLGNSLDTDAATTMFMNNRSQLPDDAQDAYGQSVAALMLQLEQSKGDPLSLETINELVQWHFERFKQNVDAEAQRKAAAQVDTLRSLAIAGSGVVVFVVIVFFFLVVKIERNLRLVRTAPADPS